MENRALRKEILAQHAKLRLLCKELRGLVRQPTDALTANEKNHALKRKLEELWGNLETHMLQEDEHLLPALAKVDAWGAERAEAFRLGHIEQRQLIATLRTFEGLGEALTKHVEDVVTLLLADMVDEEKNFLDAKLLSDLPEIIDQTSG